MLWLVSVEVWENFCPILLIWSCDLKLWFFKSWSEFKQMLKLKGYFWIWKFAFGSWGQHQSLYCSSKWTNILCTCNMEPFIKLWPWGKIHTLELIFGVFCRLLKFTVMIITITSVLKPGHEILNLQDYHTVSSCMTFCGLKLPNFVIFSC